MFFKEKTSLFCRDKCFVLTNEPTACFVTHNTFSSTLVGWRVGLTLDISKVNKSVDKIMT